jgi:hypothetical protein
MRVPLDALRLHDDMGNCDDFLAPEDEAVLDAGTWFRASGDCECAVCAQSYWKHPQVLGALWLHRLCDGELVKL